MDRSIPSRPSSDGPAYCQWMPTDVRSLQLRALACLTFSALAVSVGVVRGEHDAENRRPPAPESGIGRGEEALAAPSPAGDTLAARNLARTSTVSQDIRIAVSSEGSPVSRYELTIDRRKRSSTEA